MLAMLKVLEKRIPEIQNKMDVTHMYVDYCAHLLEYVGNTKDNNYKTGIKS